MAKAKEKKPDISTEEKIKEAARAVFYRKGFAATRTRDIAQEADINLALLNYYYRSKQKLFEIIILETLSHFLKNIQIVLNDEKTTLEQKVQEVSTAYIDLILREPEIPTFLLSEMRSNNPTELLSKLPARQTILDSVFFKQYGKAVELGKIAEPNALHFFFNLMGMIVFPFITKPMIMEVAGLSKPAFNQLMQERKKLIPTWIKAIMKAK